MQWEYSKLDLKDALQPDEDMKLLERAGAEGWELVIILATTLPTLGGQSIFVSRSGTQSSGRNADGLTRMNSPQS